MKKYIYLIGLLLSAFFTSCGSVSVLTYDQLCPADLSFPSGIRQVGVVNNSAPRAVKPSGDLILGVFQGEGTALSEALATNLADSKFFDQVIICDSALQDMGTDPIADPELSVDKVNLLTTDLGVDLLISIEALWVQTSKKKIQYPGWDIPIDALQATATPLVRIYLPGKAHPLYTMTPSDSIFCDLGAPLSEKIILDEVTKMMADKVTNYLVPTWKQVERPYFTGGGIEMRDAAVCINEGNWQEAQNYWKSFYDRLKKGNMKARVSYNIALSYEMLGDLEEALKWIHQSAEYAKANTQEEQLIKHYSHALTRRIQEMVSLNSQMNRFNNNF